MFLRDTYLTIHSVSNPPMPRYAVTKILYFLKKIIYQSKQKKYNPKVSEIMEQYITFILKALLKPLAKKPPNGAIIDANRPRAKACHCTGIMATSFHGNC